MGAKTNAQGLRRRDIFISFSAEDLELARALQRGLKLYPYLVRYAFQRARKLDVFLANQNIAAGSSLPQVLRDAISHSEFFVLVASPSSARSAWVHEEVEWWLSKHPRAIDKLIVVLAEGDLRWQKDVDDFDWTERTPLPPNLRGRFANEPLYVDATGFSFRSAEDRRSAVKSREFKDVLATICAPVRGVDKSSLVFEEVQAQRKIIGILVAVASSLLVLSAVAVWSAYAAVRASAAEADARDEVERQLANLAVVERSAEAVVGPAVEGATDNFTRPIVEVDGLWLAAARSGALVHVDAGTMTRTRIESICARPRAPRADDEFIWIVCEGMAGQLVRVRKDTYEKRALPLGHQPNALLLHDQWVLSVLERAGLIVRMKREPFVEVDRIKIGSGATVTQLVNDEAWILNTDRALLLCFELSNGSLTKYSLPEVETPRGLHLIAGNLWMFSASGIDVFDVAERTWKAKLRTDGALYSPVVGKRWVWTFDPERERLLALDPADASVQAEPSLTVPPRWMSIVEERLWVLSSNGKVSWRHLKAPDIPVYARPEYPAETLPPVSDGRNLWFVVPSTGTIEGIDLVTGEHAFQFAHCAGPQDLSFDGLNLWVVCAHAGTLMRIPSTLAHIGVEAHRRDDWAHAPVFDGRLLWLVHEDTPRIVAYDPERRRDLLSVTLPGTPLPIVKDLAASSPRENYLWVFTTKGAGVRINLAEVHDRIGTRRTVQVRADRTSPFVDRVLDLGNEVSETIVTDKSIWIRQGSTIVAAKDRPDVTVIDRRRGEIDFQLNLGRTASGLGVSAGVGFVSIISTNESSVARVSESTGEVLSRTRLDYSALKPIFDGDDVWLSGRFPANLGDIVFNLGAFLGKKIEHPARLYRLSGSTGRLLNQYSFVPGMISDVTVTNDNLWFTHASMVQDLNILRQDGATTLHAVTKSDPSKMLGRWPICSSMGPPLLHRRLLWFQCASQRSDEGQLVVFDPEKMNVVRQYQAAGENPWPLSARGSVVWAVYADSNIAMAFDADNAVLVRKFGLGRSPTPPLLDSGAGTYWFSNSGDGSVQTVRLR
ncbi:MAG: toll/interleukin-1 receptor domain-containing protein [Pseudomonadota bacterium]